MCEFSISRTISLDNDIYILCPHCDQVINRSSIYCLVTAKPNQEILFDVYTHCSNCEKEIPIDSY